MPCDGSGPDDKPSHVRKVLGGFAEITATGVSVLAEQALRRAEVTPDVHARLVEEARAAVAQAQGTDRVDDAGEYLSDVTALV